MGVASETAVRALGGCRIEGQDLTSEICEFDFAVVTGAGQSPPSHVCNAHGTQGVDLLAGVHYFLGVSWAVCRVLPYRRFPPCHASYSEPLHLK